MQTTELLRQKLLSDFPVPISPYCIIDSFPLAVCKFGRARYCKAVGKGVGNSFLQKKTRHFQNQYRPTLHREQS